MFFPKIIKYLVTQSEIGLFLKVYPFYFVSTGPNKLKIVWPSKVNRFFEKILANVSLIGMPPIFIYLMIPVFFAQLNITEKLLITFFALCLFTLFITHRALMKKDIFYVMSQIIAAEKCSGKFRHNKLM